MLSLSDEFFLIPKDGKFLLWDFSSHKQYLLDREHADGLVSCIYDSASEQSSSKTQAVLQNYLNKGILRDNPTPERKWAWDLLSRLFHVGTQNIPASSTNLNREAYVKHYQELSRKFFAEFKNIAAQEKQERLRDVRVLPEPEVEILNQSFHSLLKKRRSVRQFVKESLSLQEMSNLLHYSAGHSTEARKEGQWTIGARRYVPSPGNLHPTNLWIVAHNIEGLEPGLYRYYPDNHSLGRKGPAPTQQQLVEALQSQFFLEDSACSLIFTTSFERLWTKYPHSRAYRMGFVEIGAIVQNIQLLCAAQNFSSWMSGAFTDSFFNELLGLDNERESAMFFMSLGKSSGEILPQEFFQ